jgi:hypothetical protein
MIQICFYILVWILNEYVAFLLFIIIPVIAIAILLLSFVFQFIEPAKIPTSYYKYMVATIIAPVFVAIIYFAINGFQQEWMFNN